MKLKPFTAGSIGAGIGLGLILLFYYSSTGKSPANFEIILPLAFLILIPIVFYYLFSSPLFVKREKFLERMNQSLRGKLAYLNDPSSFGSGKAQISFEYQGRAFCLYDYIAAGSRVHAPSEARFSLQTKIGGSFSLFFIRYAGKTFLADMASKALLSVACYKTTQPVLKVGQGSLPPVFGGLVAYTSDEAKAKSFLSQDEVKNIVLGGKAWWYRVRIIDGMMIFDLDNVPGLGRSLLKNTENSLSILQEYLLAMSSLADKF